MSRYESLFIQEILDRNTNTYKTIHHKSEKLKHIFLFESAPPSRSRINYPMTSRMEDSYDSDTNASTISLEFEVAQTTNKCMEAVKQNGLELEFVWNQLPKICLAAVKQNGLALEFVEEQTDEICLAAVKQNGLALEFVEEQTDEICLAAVRQNGFAIKYVLEQTIELCEAAYQQIKQSKEYMDEQFQSYFSQAIRPTYYEQLPDFVERSELTDPITLEQLSSQTVSGWIVEENKWYFAGSLVSFNEMIELSYKGSSDTHVFVPLKNDLFPIKNLHWVRL